MNESVMKELESQAVAIRDKYGYDGITLILNKNVDDKAVFVFNGKMALGQILASMATTFLETVEREDRADVMTALSVMAINNLEEAEEANKEEQSNESLRK